MFYKKTKMKIQKITAIISILILILLPGLFSCNNKAGTANDSEAETGFQTSKISNLFDARDVSNGDIITGMKIVSVNVYPGSDPDNKDNYFATVKFSGKLELSGKYISYSDQPLLGRSVIFYPDNKSANLIPRLNQDTIQEVWFLIENYEEAIEILSEPDSEGNATIIIDNYTINYTLEVVHTAQIISVPDKNITTTREDADGEESDMALGNKIIFSSTDGYESSIFMCDPDGSNLEKIIEGGIFTSPSWNKEHTKIVYTSIDSKSGISSIFIYDLESKSSNLLLKRFSPLYPSFSPDGKTVIFADFSEKNVGNYEIYSVNIDGADLKRFTNDPGINFFSKYSPDGSLILFSGEEEGNIQLYLMESNGENIRQITDNEFTNNHGIFSPDGKSIIFESNQNGKIDLYSMSLDGNSQPQNLTNNSADNFEASFSPDGSMIVFKSNKNTAYNLIYDIFIMFKDGRNQINITSQLKNSAESNPSWSW